MDTTVMTRKDFLKKFAVGVFGLAAVLGIGTAPVITEVREKTSDSNIVTGAVAPLDHTKMWLNTGSVDNTEGINGRSVPVGALCYWDTAKNGWKPTTATWG